MRKNVVEYLGYYCDHVYEAQDGEELNSTVWQGEMSEGTMRTVVKALRRQIS